MTGHLIVIPARLESSRFPRKVLADMAGKPMLQWTWETARRVLPADNVAIATDSDEVEDVACKFGAVVIRTSQYRNGTERVAEVARKYPNAKRIVNLQADEPCIQSGLLQSLLDCRLERDEIGTVAQSIQPMELEDRNTVKVAVTAAGHVAWFSRGPFTPMPEFTHVGVYAFQKETLCDCVRMDVTTWEMNEQLEQLRWLDHGCRFRVLLHFGAHIPSVNAPCDLETAARFLT